MHAKTGLITSTVVSVFLGASLAMTGCAGSQPSAQGTEITSDSTVESTTAEAETALDNVIVEDVLEDTGTSSTAEVADPGATAAASAAAEYATDSTAAAAAEASTDSTAAAADAASTDSTAAAAVVGSTGAEDVASAAINDGVPARDAAGPDTELLESQLSLALVSCTGWGGTAGSSLRAAAAATELLAWSGKAAAASADPAVLKEAVKKEYDRLSADQQENLKANWFFTINYDVDTILNDFDDISGSLEDAGCLEAAKEAASAPDAKKNWQAASNAIDSILK